MFLFVFSWGGWSIINTSFHFVVYYFFLCSTKLLTFNVCAYIKTKHWEVAAHHSLLYCCLTGIIGIKGHDFHVDKAWVDKKERVSFIQVEVIYIKKSIPALAQFVATYSSTLQHQAPDSRKSRHKAESLVRSLGRDIQPGRGGTVPA